MIINSRMERRLSILATALLTAAIFVAPLKTHALTERQAGSTGYVELATVSPMNLLFLK